MATNEQIHIEDGSEGMYRNENTLLKKGILAGILTLGFACTASSVLSFVRRVQELKKIKRHEVIRKNLTSEETDYVGCTTEQAPDLFLRCSCCGKEAHDIDEITVLFGYQKMENGKLSPYNYSKPCRALLMILAEKLY